MRWARLQFLRGSRQQRSRIRQWLDRHPAIARLLERGGSLHVTEYALARGVAVGLFIGLTPTVGIQTLLMLVASLVFRANFPAAFIVSFVSNPFTMAPLYYGFNRLGQWILSWLPVAQTPATALGDEIARETLALLLGSLVIAAPAALLGYLAFLGLWRRLGLKLPYTKRQTATDSNR